MSETNEKTENQKIADLEAQLAELKKAKPVIQNSQPVVQPEVPVPQVVVPEGKPDTRTEAKRLIDEAKTKIGEALGKMMPVVMGRADGSELFTTQQALAISNCAQQLQGMLYGLP